MASFVEHSEESLQKCWVFLDGVVKAPEVETQTLPSVSQQPLHTRGSSLYRLS